MEKEKLTKKQTEILEFVTGYIREYGYAPSYREVADHFGISSTATVHEHIKNLEKKGYLTSDDGARSISVEEKVLRAVDALLLPFKGLITAGQPIEAVETDETIEVPESMVSKIEDTYALRVKGESMIDDGILSGDVVIVERNPAPRDGQTVVALLDGEFATLKRYYKEKGRIRLQPANSTMKPIYATDVTVQGVVRAVLRNYR